MLLCKSPQLTSLNWMELVQEVVYQVIASRWVVYLSR